MRPRPREGRSRRFLSGDGASPDPFSLRVGEARNVWHRIHEHLGAAVVEMEPHPCETESSERTRDVLLRIGAAVKEKEAPAAGSRDLSPGRSGIERDLVEPIEPVVAYARRQPFLSLPGLVEDLADLAESPRLERLAHRERIPFDSVEVVRHGGTRIAGRTSLGIQDGGGVS